MPIVLGSGEEGGSPPRCHSNTTLSGGFCWMLDLDAIQRSQSWEGLVDSRGRRVYVSKRNTIFANKEKERRTSILKQILRTTRSLRKSPTLVMAVLSWAFLPAATRLPPSLGELQTRGRGAAPGAEAGEAAETGVETCAFCDSQLESSDPDVRLPCVEVGPGHVFHRNCVEADVRAGRTRPRPSRARRCR